ncbi:carboxylating nicotinate-nucleotide diphosphorylase [Brassicibacter mesophilus]|uniref:carboxylating nicotinate-nucleotide diphosphorylase n=1 Tax=Brassicibacter mesophilus TaxID=745119 RepID=UPI003D24C135
MKKLYLENIIKNALLEDMNNGDITTDSLIDEDSLSVAEIKAKEDGVIAGIDVARMVFELLDDAIIFEKYIDDGFVTKKGDIIARITGKTRAILSGERTALNLLQRMSGIATTTAMYSERIKKYNAKIVDTRKTVPGLRILDKYSVRMGGGINHRFNLSDAILIKDNHIKAAGGITEAINIVKSKIPHTVKIEVEVETLDQLKEALDANADVIMLDNMDTAAMKQAVVINNKKAIIEASGNMSLGRILEVAETGVDIISVGALTHSVKALDISLNILSDNLQS